MQNQMTITIQVDDYEGSTADYKFTIDLTTEKVVATELVGSAAWKSCTPGANLKEVWIEMDEPFLKQQLETIKEIGGPNIINIFNW